MSVIGNHMIEHVKQMNLVVCISFKNKNDAAGGTEHVENIENNVFVQYSICDDESLHCYSPYMV